MIVVALVTDSTRYLARVFPIDASPKLDQKLLILLLILQSLKLNINLYDNESLLPTCITPFSHIHFFYMTFPLHLILRLFINIVYNIIYINLFPFQLNINPALISTLTRNYDLIRNRKYSLLNFNIIMQSVNIVHIAFCTSKPQNCYHRCYNSS